MVIARTCKLCGEGFELEYGRGRPRVYCLTCQPEGWKIVRLPHRTKLRRLNPLMPRVPAGGWAEVYRLPQ